MADKPEGKGCASMDTKTALKTWTGTGAHEAAERATKKGSLHDLAQEWGHALEARKLKEDHVQRAGVWVTVTTWGVFLAPEAPQEDPQGAQDAPRGSVQAYRTSS